MQFVHLHLHTQYSLLDGANKIPEVLVQAHAMGQPAIAITDHGNMHGAVEFFAEAKKIGIKPIIGCEIYLNPVSRFERKTKQQGGAGTYHLTLLAKNKAGYKNLCKLVTLAYQEGFYFKPRVDHELLEKYSEGLIALSGCMNSVLNSHVRVNDFDKSRKLVEFYASIFKDNFYLEVQPHPIDDQQALNKMCAELGKMVGLPLVATTDCHYPNKEDHYAQEVLMCVSTGKQITDPDRLRHEGLNLHLKSTEEMLEELSGFSRKEEAISNTLEIAKQCELEFDFKTYHMPLFSVGDNQSLIDVMATKARQGLDKRIEFLSSRSVGLSYASKDIYRNRLEEEIRLIDKMGFAGYFLVVSDFIVWAKEQGIPVGPGRGSVAGSLVAYALRITEIDPISNKLLFERFLNPERISLPDIDVDFCIYGRDKVIQYVVGKYGKDRVAQIATFGTMKAKAAIKDVGRALGIGYAECGKIAELVPAPRQGFDYPLAEAIKMEPRLKEYANGSGKELISLALKLEGLTRHASTHAAGVVIGNKPLVEFLPLMVDKEGRDVTQYEMSSVEKIGLVKFDFLGLKTLTVIHTALQLIKEGTGLELDPNAFPIDDTKSYELLSAGNTTGVFQLESSGITDMTARLHPSCFDDIVAILALYRPGPLDAGMVEHYIERKHGREPVTFLHPAMKPILSDTYGIMIYQEQIMQLARELAGYSLGEADLLRKAMGKKNPEEMAKHRDRFTDGAVKRDISRHVAQEIFNQMETFARYGFNRSHSAAYALISFQTAYLKAHYQVEFMAALMSHEMDDSDKTLKNLNECRRHGIKVLPPDVNYSNAGFSIDHGAIRFGMEAVKGIGSKAVEVIIDSRRRNGSFKDLEDLLERVDLSSVNKKVIETLINSGALDFSGVTRREMWEQHEDLLRYAQSLQRDTNSNQISLFGNDSALNKIPRRRGKRAEWPVNRKLALEREALGLYLSGHPLTKFQLELKRIGTTTTAELKARTKSGSARIAGVVTALKLKNTKAGDRYAAFTLEDSVATVETLVWPDVYRQVSHLIVADDPVIVSGRVDIGEERVVFIAEKMESLIALRDKSATVGILSLLEQDNLEGNIDKLLSIFEKYLGNCPVRVNLAIDKREVSMVLKNRSGAALGVIPSETLCEDIEQLFGRPVLSFV